MVDESTAVANQPEVREIMSMAEAVTTYATNLVVATEEQYKTAAERLMNLKTAKKKLDEKRTNITRPMQASLKAVLDLFRTPGDALAQAETVIKDKMNGYTREQERIRLEAQRKADAEATAERNRLQAIADEAQRKAREEEDRLRAEAAAAEAEGRAAEAAKLAAKADKVVEKADVKATKLADQAAAVVAPVVAAATPQVAGISSRQVWKYRIKDATKIPREFLMPDETKLGAYGRAMKANANVAGVEFYPDDVMAAGRR